MSIELNSRVSPGMKRYIGVKIVHAEPCSLGEAEDYLNRSVGPIGGTREMPGYLVVYPDQYESWCPKEQFEKANRLCEGMGFGHALEAMKKGLKVARAEWHTDGMYLQVQMPDENSKMTSPYLFLTVEHDGTAGCWRFPWNPTSVDLFADDWKAV